MSSSLRSPSAQFWDTGPPTRNGRFRGHVTAVFFFSIRELTVTGQLELRIVCALLKYLVQALRYKSNELRKVLSLGMEWEERC